MAIQRFLLRLAAIMAVALMPGCERASQPDSPAAPSDTSSLAGPQTAGEFLQLAKRLQQSRDYNGAAGAVSKSLIQDPGNVDAKLLAAQLEAARGNLATAAEIASSIDLNSRLGGAAVDLHVKLLLQLNRKSEAAEAMVQALQAGRDVPQWRHEAWRLLNQLGRREEASAQAISLCRSGQANEQELLSLISRASSFPTPEMLQGRDDADRLFSGGLGKARWYFSLGEHRRALDELAEQYDSGFRTAAAEALYGRLLAETQSWDEFRKWNQRCSQQAKQLATYWAAIGNFFIDNHRNEAAARALLEAVRRDPTDRTSVQRLSRVLFAIGRPEDAEQFQHRGIEIADTESAAQLLYASPRDIETRKKLTRDLMELGRPFETLAWTLTMLPTGATGPRQRVAQQRTSLLRDPSAIVMAAESSLLGLEPTEFDLKSAWRELLSDGTAAKTEAVAARREISATPRLVNRAKETGLDFQWYKDVEIKLESIPIHESLGGGIAVLDYDLDGWADVYLAQGSGDPPTDKCTRSSQLFRNQAQTFRQITSSANVDDYHYSSGLTAGDVNQDGFPDLYLGSLGHNRLLINNGDGTFRDASGQLGDDPDRFSTSLGIADLNGDRLPDLFESNYIEMEGGFALPRPGADGRLLAPSPLSHYADSDRWLENLGDGRFRVHEIGRDVAKPGTGLGLVITDFDSDGKNEVFVGNDVRPNHYLVQSGENGFVNVADSNGLANGFAGAANGCMGIATGDFNRDGRFDLQIANYAQEAANLYLQTPTGDFTDSSMRYGLADLTRPGVGFGTKAADIDRNGFLDFIVTNGHIFDMRDAGEGFQMAPQLMMSDGRSLQLAKVEDDSGYWDGTYLGRAIAKIDYDRDGAIDFLVGHLDQPLALLHDETRTGGNWIHLELVGTQSERDAIGARVVLTVGESRFTEWVTAGDGYFCNDEPVVTFAFAESDRSGPS